MKSETPYENENLSLILRAQNGDETAKTNLLALYKPLIEKLSYGFSEGLPDDDQNDLFQEASLAFLHALEQFDTEKGIAFGYFAKICISNRLTGYLRKRMTSLPENALPLEDIELPADDDPSKSLRDEESYLALCEQIRKILSDFEYRIWMRYVSGQTVQMIAQIAGTDKKSVENALVRARRKLIKNLPPR